VSKLNRKKLIIVGYKSFIQLNLFNHLKKKFNVKKIKFVDLSQNIIKNSDLIINCSNTKNFYEKRYSRKFDRNLIISNLIKNSKIKLIILSSRQIYKPKLNLSEKSIPEPINIYAKNCYKSEKLCQKIIKNKLLILRLSNIIGYESGRKKKASLMSMIIKGIKKGIISFDNNYYLKKDFLPINLFCLYIEKLISKNICGILNIGSGIPIKVNELVKTLVDVKKVKIIIKSKINFKDKDYSFKINKLQMITGIRTDKKKLKKYFFSLKRRIN